MISEETKERLWYIIDDFLWDFSKRIARRNFRIMGKWLKSRYGPILEIDKRSSFWPNLLEVVCIKKTEDTPAKVFARFLYYTDGDFAELHEEIEHSYPDWIVPEYSFSVDLRTPILCKWTVKRYIEKHYVVLPLYWDIE